MSNLPAISWREQVVYSIRCYSPSAKSEKTSN